MRLNVYTKTMIRSATLFHNTTPTAATCFYPGRPELSFTRPDSCRWPRVRLVRRGCVASQRIYGTNASPETLVADLPDICTADELHYVSVHNSDWRLALWRYKASPQATPRNHPLLLLSGVGTNAIGYDLAPGSSFARYMSSQGFDTWILEFRGAGLSAAITQNEIKQEVDVVSGQIDSIKTKINGKNFEEKKSEATADTAQSQEVGPNSLAQSEVSSGSKISEADESQFLTYFTENFMALSERLSSLLNEGFSEMKQSYALVGQIRDLSQRLLNIIEEGQRSVSPQFVDLVARYSTTVEDFRKQLDLMAKYNWDFDHYLEEDVPAAMEYVRRQCKPTDGKLLAIGHSMGGILLYAMLSKNGCQGQDSYLASIITLGSSLDYTTSESSLKLLLPLVDPAQALNVPVVPLGALLAAAYPLAFRPPYVLSWLNPLITAQETMQPELMEKFVLNNFCTVPAKLLYQLTSAFQNGGLCDRTGKFFYKDHLHKIDIPVLAIAGDKDLICPPEAVHETIKLVPEHLVDFKVFGRQEGPHYAHYDLVGGPLAPDHIYPVIIDFLSRHDQI
ncbi:hypothetical protein ACET3Z_020767 [Daucus carota]